MAKPRFKRVDHLKIESVAYHENNEAEGLLTRRAGDRPQLLHERSQTPGKHACAPYMPISSANVSIVCSLLTVSPLYLFSGRGILLWRMCQTTIPNISFAYI